VNDEIIANGTDPTLKEYLHYIVKGLPLSASPRLRVNQKEGSDPGVIAALNKWSGVQSSRYRYRIKLLQFQELVADVPDPSFISPLLL
jgi:hypothetical protein